jgi:hypothetical protein
MSVVTLLSAPLPRNPPNHQQWAENEPNLQSAYDLTVYAEHHATQKLHTNPNDREAKENITSARVAGYLLIALFDRRGALTDKAWRQVSNELRSQAREHGDEHDRVFAIGKWYRNYFLRACTMITFSTMSFGTLTSLQFGHLLTGTPYPPHTQPVLRSIRWRR